MHPRARQLIDSLGLQEHPEGGYYRRLFTSAQRDGERAACSSIVFLLLEGQASRWHRVDADEIWHFHEGDALELLIAESPVDLRIQRLGPHAAEQSPQAAVPAHAWQAARALGAFSLVGCTVAPEFRFDGFCLLADDAEALREWPRLAGEFPQLV